MSSAEFVTQFMKKLPQEFYITYKSGLSNLVQNNKVFDQNSKVLLENKLSSIPEE